MIRTILMGLFICLVFGIIRLPVENSILKQEASARLLPESLPKELQKELGNQLAFISLGGLRSIVASFLSIEAFTYYKQEQWDELENKYKLIVSLAPQTAFYWKSAASYLAKDAASSFLRNTSLPIYERRLLYKKYIDKGNTFLDYGIKANPENWELYAEKGIFMEDTLRYPNYEKAAHMFHKAVELGAPPYYQRAEFYCLARTPKQSLKALHLGQQLFQDPRNRTSRMGTLLFALQNKLNVPPHERIPVSQLFLDEEDARHQMMQILYNMKDDPADGFRKFIDSPSPNRKH